MKFSEDILNQFDLNPIEDREPVNVMQVSEMLDFMKAAADRIVLKSHLYLKSQDADEEADCIDIVTAKLNEITHDYFNRELHQRKLIWIMQNCSDGAVEVYEHIYRYCKDKQLLDRYAEKIV